MHKDEMTGSFLGANFAAFPLKSMIVSSWSNGSVNPWTGAGYGIRVTKEDRDAHFYRDWGCIELELPGEADFCKVNIDKDSFWNNCSELIKKEIGAWLIENNYGTWPEGEPFTFDLIPIGGRRFSLQIRE